MYRRLRFDVGCRDRELQIADGCRKAFSAGLQIGEFENLRRHVRFQRARRARAQIQLRLVSPYHSTVFKRRRHALSDTSRLQIKLGHFIGSVGPFVTVRERPVLNAHTLHIQRHRRPFGFFALAWLRHAL